MFDSTHHDTPIENEQIEAGLLESMTPGPELAAAVSRIDLSAVSSISRVKALQANRRLVSHFQAQESRAMIAVVDACAAVEPGAFHNTEEAAEQERLHHAETLQMAASEIRAALRLTRRTADNQLLFAVDLIRKVPSVYRALWNGDIDIMKAKVLIRGTEHLDAGPASNVIDSIIGEAPALTSGQLRALLRERTIKEEPEDASHRFETAHDNRYVYMEPTVDGTAHIHALDLAPDDAAAIMKRIQTSAKRSHTGDSRLMDQRRADAFVAALRGGAPHRERGSVDVVVDVRTLAGLTDQPAELNGYGPIIAEIARNIAVEQNDGQWTFTITDGDVVLSTGTLRRRPTASMQRLVEARDRKCVFPGCRTPSRDCDLDHRREVHDGGPTHTDNLSPLCRHDHRLKSTGRWKYERIDGEHRWTSPLGLRYTNTGRAP